VSDSQIGEMFDKLGKIIKAVAWQTRLSSSAQAQDPVLRSLSRPHEERCVAVRLEHPSRL
jgi:hypothetical protein